MHFNTNCVFIEFQVVYLLNIYVASHQEGVIAESMVINTPPPPPHSSPHLPTPPHSIAIVFENEWLGLCGISGINI